MLDYTGVCVCLQTPMYIHVYDAVSNYIYMLLYNFWLLLYLLTCWSIYVSSEKIFRTVNTWTLSAKRMGLQPVMPFTNSDVFYF